MSKKISSKLLQNTSHHKMTWNTGFSKSQEDHQSEPEIRFWVECQETVQIELSRICKGII